MFRLHHIALSVSTLDESVRFYSALGFKEVLRWEAGDGSLATANLKLGEVFLELFSLKHFEPAPESSREIETDLPVIGVKHFALSVDSIEEARESLSALGVTIKTEPARGRTGIDYFFIEDPDGIMIEIVQDERGLE